MQKEIALKIRNDEREMMASWNGSVFSYQEKEFFVDKRVYVPEVASLLMVDNYCIKSGDHVLDIGTGSGFIAILSAYKGADKVVAIDINPDAINNAKTNVERHQFSSIIDVRLSDMFEKVRADEEFDVVTVNLPFVIHPSSKMIERALWDPEFVAHKLFFKGIRNFLRLNGRIYIVQANFGAVDELKRLVSQTGFSINKIAQVNVPFDKEYEMEFYLFELY